MSTYMFLHIYIHMLMVITSEINHVVQRKLPNPILSIILPPNPPPKKIWMSRAGVREVGL